MNRKSYDDSYDDFKMKKPFGLQGFRKKNQRFKSLYC